MNKILLIALAGVLVVAGLVFVYQDQIIQMVLAAQPPSEDVQIGLSLDDLSDIDVETLAQDLQIPWAIDFLPSGDLLVTERPGRLLRVGRQGTSFEIEGVEHIGEGGLLGMVIHPDIQGTRWLYLYLTTQTENGLRNRVERYEFRANQLSQKTVLLDDIPGASFHDGGRIAFGPDGNLYITTGDAGNENSAQDLNSLAGKILRMTEEGDIPDDNPFGTYVYSYGHRNPQGLAWDDGGQLWSTEHGPSGFPGGHDELNLIEPGNNYGWPVIIGDETQDGMETPVLHSGPDYTWAPAGAAYWDGSIFFAGLRGSALYEAKLQPNGPPQLIAHFNMELGRLREVHLGPDGMLYLSTSNTDGRATPNPGDDVILRINPSVFR